MSINKTATPIQLHIAYKAALWGNSKVRGISGLQSLIYLWSGHLQKMFDNILV
jgi:hypothetical protein